MTDGAKSCPQCAESVKSAARICRFCGYQFPGAGTTASKNTANEKIEKGDGEDPTTMTAKNTLRGCLALAVVVVVALFVIGYIG